MADLLGPVITGWSPTWERRGYTLRSPDGYFNLYAPSGVQIGWGLLGYRDAMRVCISHEAN